MNDETEELTCSDEETFKDVSLDTDPDESEESVSDYSWREINTYDPLPLSRNAIESEGRPEGIIKKIFSFFAICTLFLAVIFSSAEIFDLIVNDMGTGNMIMKRIFGQSISGEGLNLSELIIENAFIIPEEKDAGQTVPPIDEPIEPPAESDEAVPNETILPETTTDPEESLLPPKESQEPPPKEDAPLKDGQHPILNMDMSLLSYGKNYIYNNTSLSPSITELSSAEIKNYYKQNAPLVLVIHTHGTEGYMPDGATYYTDNVEIARTENTNENMIAIGKEFVRVLEENGVSTIHCTIMHDKESYRESYSRAAESIAKYLKEYPSIKYIFDLHRDSLMRSTGELISAVTSIDGESCAQIMPVIGSGFGGWEENMTFALKLRNKLNDEFVNLCRPVCLRESNYNQNMSAVSVLLEIGTSGNTLKEAKKAAAMTAQAIAELIKYQK